MSRSPHRSEDGYAALAAAEEEYLRSQAQARERTGAWRELVGRSSLPRKVDGPLVERMSESRWRAPMRGWDSWVSGICPCELYVAAPSTATVLEEIAQWFRLGLMPLRDLLRAGHDLRPDARQHTPHETLPLEPIFHAGLIKTRPTSQTPGLLPLFAPTPAPASMMEVGKDSTRLTRPVPLFRDQTSRGVVSSSRCGRIHSTTAR
jgi:hypothetical protein